VVTFGRVLREAGLEVGPGRIADALTGLDQVALERRDDVYWTLRTTLVTRVEEIEPFDRAFRAWFERAPVVPPLRVAARLDRRQAARGARSEAPRTSAAPERDGELEIGFSADEVLREKDFAAMTPEEFARVRALMAETASARPRRRSRRLRPHHRGDRLDLRRLARSSLAAGGDPVERSYRRRVDAPRKVVLLCDVSGSMDLYSRFLLQFIFALQSVFSRVETFTFSVRLTRVTEHLRGRSYREVLRRLSAVRDWSGGTRIGESLGEFNRRWPGLVDRRTIVIILSDGWDTGDPEVLAAELLRIKRRAGRVIWLNPLLGNPSYEPLTRGMAAALPLVDQFAAAHNLAALRSLAGTLRL
jgi:uncharacterized protein with von Willebrand factor type A (vWA) domain